MAIKRPESYALGQPKVKNFPKKQFEKIVEMIDKINDLDDGELEIDTITPPSGTLTVAGALTASGSITASAGVVIPVGQVLRTDEITARTSGGAITFNDELILSKGTVTQLTNITTTVVLNQGSGVITTVALNTAAGAVSGPFTVTNSTVLSTSVVLASIEYAAGLTGVPVVNVEGVTAGSFKLKIGNGGSAALNGVVKIHFVVL